MSKHNKHKGPKELSDAEITVDELRAILTLIETVIDYGIWSDDDHIQLFTGGEMQRLYDKLGFAEELADVKIAIEKKA